VLPNDRKEALTTLRIFDRAVLESLDERDDRRERSTQLMRNVREKLLPHDLQPLRPRDIEEDTERTFRSVAVRTDRHYAQIEYLSLWSMRLDFNAAAFDAFKTIQKRTVDRGIARQLGEALRLQRGH